MFHTTLFTSMLLVKEHALIIPVYGLHPLYLLMNYGFYLYRETAIVLQLYWGRYL